MSNEPLEKWNSTYLAHISKDGARAQSLYEHLRNTAKIAGRFASAFDSEEWGYGCGMVHDIGKYSVEFQRRVRGDTIRVDHATAGARELFESKNPLALFASYCVAGHHAGLPDGGSSVDTGDSATLRGRLKKKVKDYQAYRQEITLPDFSRPVIKTLGKGGYSISFFIRMLYSCLVDADFLDTEDFMTEGKAPRSQYDSMEVLLERIQKHTKLWLKNTDLATVNGRRSEILRSCFHMGNEKQGLYTLTVPTGGGKTVSSLAFALQHAVTHHLDRIIYVIPYTSIIEQNAAVFRDILGNANVLENHCNVEYDEEVELNPLQLAAENWDIPVIVTTNVQFFESLYANKSTRCRKLHNLAKSVIIFDEAQMLPVEYLRPCVRAIAELVHNYHSTAVICTATQPTLQKLFPDTIHAKEICPRVKEQYEFFRRTIVENAGEIVEEDLVKRLCGEKQVLCILNNRKQVQHVYEALEGDGIYHLSTLMYPKHRKRVLEEIRERLSKGEACKVISTSLVEAGVDLDFMTVYRELAGIDSVVQAAGRCNREGLRALEGSKTYVFTMKAERKGTVSSSLRLPVSVSEQVIRTHKDLASLEAIQEYFNQLHYIKGEGLDKKEMVAAFEDAKSANYPFAEIAKSFHLIENNTKTILIENEQEAKQIADQLRWGIRTRQLIRKAGHYSVNVFEKDFENMQAAGMLEVLDSELAILRDGKQYSDQMGLKMDVERGDAVIWDSKSVNSEK